MANETGTARRAFLLGSGGAVISALAGSSPVLGAADIAESLWFVDPELRPAARAEMANQQAFGLLDDQILPRIRANSPPPAQPAADIPIEHLRIPVGPGDPLLGIYLINARRSAPQPVILHMHGGGMVLGKAEDDLVYLQDIARDLSCTIVSVDYRLAPEARWQQSIEDNYAALAWVAANAAAIGVDPARIALMGESAGGGHAALLALTARDRNVIRPVLQVLIYPMLDDRTGSGVIPPFPAGAVGWKKANNAYGWRSFLGQEPGTDSVPARAVPARATDLAGLPPAFIAVGTVDLFVAEDVAYASRLIAAGVPAELHVLPGAFHAFERVAPETRIARQFVQLRQNALRRALHG